MNLIPENENQSITTENRAALKVYSEMFQNFEIAP